MNISKIAPVRIHTLFVIRVVGIIIIWGLVSLQNVSFAQMHCCIGGTPACQIPPLPIGSACVCFAYPNVPGQACMPAAPAPTNPGVQSLSGDCRAVFKICEDEYGYPPPLVAQGYHIECLAKGIEYDDTNLTRSFLRCAQESGTVDYDAQGLDQEELLHTAAEEGNSEITKILITQGRMSVNHRNDDDETPLHIAAWEGHTGVVKTLIQHGADVDAKDDNGNTPLHNAAQEDHRGIFKILVKANANTHIKNDEGQIAGDYLK